MFLAVTQHKGFTLIELLVTLAIAAILVGIGAPSFTSLIQSNRSATQVNSLLSAINLARSEAMKRADTVSVVSASDATDWSTGWHVYVDTDNDASYDAGEEIRTFGALPSSSNLSATSTEFSVDKNGFLNDLRTSETIVWTLTQTDCAGDLNRTLSLSQSGRSVVTRTTCP